MRFSSDRYFLFLICQSNKNQSWLSISSCDMICNSVNGSCDDMNTILCFAPFFKSVISNYLLRFDLVVYMYFSIYICNVFNLTIIVLYISEKFSFCVFWVVVIYMVVFCQDVKCTTPIWVLLCCWVFMLLCLIKFTQEQILHIFINVIWN